MNRYKLMLARAVRWAARLRGGGSALPGLVIDRLDPDFVTRTLQGLPHGVVVVSGTNGKTTTTKMVVALLEAQGLRVFTNKTGSNFVRGVAAALLGQVDRRGQLAADIAVLELDEAHAVHFVARVAPRHSLLLNVMRDQLDRFGEIDATANLLARVAQATTDTVVANREDPRLVTIGDQTKAAVVFFGLGNHVRHHFPSDDDLHHANTNPTERPPAMVTLSAMRGQRAQYIMDREPLVAELTLQGSYNLYNAAAALALVRVIMGPGVDRQALASALAQVKPAFGRGETVMIDDQPLELVLVKNPSGFRLSLASFDPAGTTTMIAINDQYADGRDMSWLWDVDFSSLAGDGVAVVSGSRADDMALRLQYDDVAVSHIDTDLAAALDHLVAHSPGQPKRIYCSYTAMLTLRRELTKRTTVEAITS